MKRYKLTDDLRYWRAARPDEWTMDRFIIEAERLEAIEACSKDTEKMENVASSSNYEKCQKEIMDYIDGENVWVHAVIDRILKKHFKTDAVKIVGVG